MLVNGAKKKIQRLLRSTESGLEKYNNKMAVVR